MSVWVYCGQHDLQIDVIVFATKELATNYAKKQKSFFKGRLIFTVDEQEVIDKEKARDGL